MMCDATVIRIGTVKMYLFAHTLMNCLKILFATKMSGMNIGIGKVYSCADCTCVLCILHKHSYCGPMIHTLWSGRWLQVFLGNVLPSSSQFYLYFMVTTCDKLSLTVNVSAMEEPEGVASVTEEGVKESQRKRKLDISVNSEKSKYN